LWSEKYRPKSIGGMVGNEEARSKLVSWLEKWKPGSKAAMLVGPPGTGKTTLVHLLAARAGLNLVELNASDVRTKTRLTARIGEALTSTSLLGERTLVFLDEVDGLSGRADYGAIEFIKDSIKGSQNPIVMAANDPDSEQVRKLGEASLVLRIRPPPPREVMLYLRMVAKKERLKVDEGLLASTAGESGGDLRYAVNSLQSGASGGKDLEPTAAQAINAFFDAPDDTIALRALKSHPGQPRDRLRDLYGSVLRAQLSESVMAEALDVLSTADVLLGRITRGQDWRLLRYFDSMLAYGLRRALAGERVQYAQDQVPWPLQLRIWNDSKKVRELAAVLGARLAISQRGLLVEDFPYLMVLCSAKKFRDALSARLDLEENVATFLAKEAGRWKG
jgi:replication factor C large subunit